MMIAKEFLMSKNVQCISGRIRCLILFIRYKLTIKIVGTNELYTFALLRFEQYLWTTNYNQFSFRSGYSTNFCIYALSKLI